MNINITDGNIKALNKEYPYLMRALHNTFNFDFNAPYKCYYIDGKFTMKKLEPYAEVFHNGETVVLIRVKPDKRDDAIGIYGYTKKYLMLVRFNPYKGGGFDIENTTPVGAWSRDAFDNFYAKGDFECMRKSDITDAWLLTQSYKVRTKPIGDCTTVKFDPTDRFKIVNRYDGNVSPDNYLWHCDFIPYGYKGHTSTPTNASLYRTTIGEYIDKSGYIFYGKQDEYKRKLAEIRAQKAKDAYLKTDNTDKVNTLARLVERYKTKLSEQLLAVKTLDDVNAVDRLIGWSGLYSIIDDYLTFKKNTENKAFASIKESDALYDRINKRIYEYI